MPIANYTTEVSAMKSVGEIQGMLVAHKAKEILIEYAGDGEPGCLGKPLEWSEHHQRENH